MPETGMISEKGLINQAPLLPMLVMQRGSQPDLAAVTLCRSKTIQNLPPALFTLMKSTEPHSDLYYQMDIEAAMRDAGFLYVFTKEADHRHRAVLGLAPGA